MRIKPAGILITLVVLAFLAYKAFKPKAAADHNENREQTETPITEPPTPDATTRPEVSPTSESAPAPVQESEGRDFAYVAEKPENGKLRGVVELGATGFNSFVINLDDQKRWEIVSKDFGASLAYEGLATTDDIRDGLKKYIGGMIDKGVSKKDIHFVISSGAQKEPKTTTISNELKKMGYIVNKVTPEQEAKLGLKATIPPSFADNSFMVDIGSGNTKISWEENGELKTLELPGAKYYEKETSNDEVYNAIKTKISIIPEGKRNVAFIIGGVPFTLAKQHRKGEERYTVLKAPTNYKAVDKKMESGLNIYKAISDATKTDTFVFDWDANFTIGFLLSLNK
ncbi:MAG: hypothetical protein ABIS36_22820 [Chryseolinea sp.]